MLHLKGLDVNTTKELVLETLKGYVERSESYKIGDFRPYANGTLAVSITIGEKEAEKLLKQGMIIVDMVRCHIERRIQLTKCFGCWSFDHTVY